MASKPSLQFFHHSVSVTKKYEGIGEVQGDIGKLEVMDEGILKAGYNILRVW